jgi:ferric-dicitrate binding protein FerR (iron transport regulator)
MEKELLVKYLNNACTGAEFDEVAEWIKTEAQREEGRAWSRNYWDLLDSKPGLTNDPKYEALLYKIHYEINLQRKDESSKVFTLPKLATWLSRVAAILFIPLLGVSFYMFSSNHFQLKRFADMAVDSLEIIAPVGSRTIVQLSDGTEVNLNYGSKIKYPRTFGNTREVILSGEGYFDVAHNPDIPFIVKTGKLNVKALGTKFNVQAYSGDDVIETTLVEGKVVIEKTIQDGKTRFVETMIPGQHVTYNLDSDIMMSSEGNVDKYVAWKEGKLVFDNESMTEIAEKLGRMFNVEFEIADNAKDFYYTATFFDDPLYLILDLMTETAPLTYRVLPRERQADGAFTKQKIKIEKRQN